MPPRASTTRPRYPSAPLRFVAFEVQFGHAPSLATDDGRAAVYERLRDKYPIADAQMVVQVAVGPLGAAPPSPATSDLVLTNRERTRSVTIGAGALTLQTTTFSDSPDLVEAISEALRAVEPVGIPTTRRVGLRFINEIRLSGVERTDRWEPFVDANLLGPVRFAGEYGVEAAETRLFLHIDEEVRAVVRFGNQTGAAVEQHGRLKLPLVEEGHFFLLDIDSFWQPPEDVPFSFEANQIVEIYRRLDEPCHQLFERAITDRSREAFREEQA